MNINLEGKIALVTGSTAGIGYAIAEGLLRSGAQVVINGRSEQRVGAALDQLKQIGAVSAVVADGSMMEGCATIIEAVPKVDVLINNLGIFAPKEFLEIADAEWEHFFNTNVMSGVRLSRHYLPAMMEAGWGRVVFVSSESALQIPKEMIHYGMTKLAQLAVARGLAGLAAGSGVTVNSVLPGPTLSEGVGNFVQDLVGTRATSMNDAGAIFMQEYRTTSLLQRMSSPTEIANLVVYLASHQASATTGAAVRVDGGLIQSVI